MVWCVSEEKSTSFTNIAHDNLHSQTVVDLQRVWKNSANGGHGQTDTVLLKKWLGNVNTAVKETWMV